MTAPIPGDYARVTKTVGIPVKGRFIALAFHNQGSCSVIYSVIVSYFFCPEFTVTSGLVFLPRSMAPESNSEPVEGRCVIDAVHYQGTVVLDCQSDGFWNISSLQGSCVCKEDMENAGGECRGIPWPNSLAGFICLTYMQHSHRLRQALEQNLDHFFLHQYDHRS